MKEDGAKLHETVAHFVEYLPRAIVKLGMTTTDPRVVSDYASGYTSGRNAAREHTPVTENPYRSGSSAFRGWNDGHYDEQSARIMAIERHSALIWSRGDSN